MIDEIKFSYLEYNPFKCPLNEAILMEYPSLCKYPEFEGVLPDLDMDKVVRYIFILYQADSPILNISDLSQRKLEAARLVNFPHISEVMFTKEVNEMMVCKNKKVNHMILRFLRVQRNRLWANLKVFEESNYKQQEKLLSDDFGRGETPQSVKKYIQETSIDISQLESKLLNQDVNPDLIATLYEAINSELKCPTPEDVARAIQDGTLEELIPNYYYDNK